MFGSRGLQPGRSCIVSPVFMIYICFGIKCCGRRGSLARGSWFNYCI